MGIDRFHLVGSGTDVRLVHTGFLHGDDWDDYLAYFQNAWPNVLHLLQEHWPG